MLSTSQTRSTAETINQVVIDQKYIIIKNIYKGKQYNIYLAIKSDQLDEKNEQIYSHYNSYEDKEKFYLIKMKKQIQQNEAIPELQFITKLQDCNMINSSQVKCIPILINYGEQMIKGSKYHYQIMERQGPSIKLFYNYVSRNIPLQILCLIAIQSLTCLELVHKHYIVHRNIKPKKLLLSNNGTEILLCDFKFACKFKKQNGSLIASENYKLISNKTFLNKYSSLGQHLNQMPTPKDDLESLAYMLLIYATNSTIFNVKAENRILKIKKWENLKLSLIPEITFKQAPLEFIHFFNLIKTSSANDFPQDYEKFKYLFRKIIQSTGNNEKDIQYPIQHMNFYDRNYQPQSQQQTVVSKFKKMQNQKMSSESIKEEAEDEGSVYQIGKIGEDRTIEPLIKGLASFIPKSISNLNSTQQFQQKIVKLKFTNK